MTKDKRAAARKKARRLEREKEKDTVTRQLIADMRKIEKKHGIKLDLRHDTVYRTAMQLNKEILSESIMYCVTATMYCLNKYYGFGHDRLIRFANRTHRIIVAVGQQIREPDKLNDEIKCETGIDIIGSFGDYKAYGGEKQQDNDKMKAACVMEKIPAGMAICMYVMYFYYGFKKKRLSVLNEKVTEVIIDYVENVKMSELTTYLKKRCGIDISFDGEIKFREKQEEI